MSNSELKGAKMIELSGLAGDIYLVSLQATPFTFHIFIYFIPAMEIFGYCSFKIKSE